MIRLVKGDETINIDFEHNKLSWALYNNHGCITIHTKEIRLNEKEIEVAAKISEYIRKGFRRV
jgi:hypothetical protein